MSTYSYDVSTEIGIIRLMIGDTDIVPITDAQFSDEEIQVFLTMASNSLLAAASYALESWASTLTAGLTSEKIGDYAFTQNEAENKMALAKKYRDEDSMTPALAWGSFNFTDEEETE